MSRADQEEHRFSVLLCGDSNVGKTTFAQHFNEGLAFDHVVLSPQATVAPEFLYVNYDLLSCNVLAHVYLRDMPGGMQNAAALPQLARDVDVFLFLYDMTQRSTFENVRGRWRQYRDAVSPKPGRVSILIGNKKDLVDADNQLRAVDREEAKQLARELQAERCFELAAKAKGREGFTNLRYPLDVALALVVEHRHAVARENDEQQSRKAHANVLDFFGEGQGQEGEAEEEGKRACCV